VWYNYYAIERFQMTEDFVKLNVHEVGILLSALQTLSVSDERVIARDYGSAPALYNKLYSIYEQMDRSKVELRYDFTPSF
jgi:hypothetical protein